MRVTLTLLGTNLIDLYVGHAAPEPPPDDEYWVLDEDEDEDEDEPPPDAEPQGLYAHAGTGHYEVDEDGDCGDVYCAAPGHQGGTNPEPIAFGFAS